MTPKVFLSIRICKIRIKKLKTYKKLYSIFYNNHNGKESEKEHIYFYVWLNHFAICKKLIQYYKSTIIQLKIKFKKETISLAHIKTM